MSLNIIKYDSPNHYNGRNGWKPDMIVMHITEGSFDGAVSWLRNPASKASAHFVVARDGRVVQLVDLKDAAWTNGTSIDKKDNVYYGHATNPIVRSRATNANYYTVTIEHEGFYSQTRGALTDAQKKAVIELIKHIRSEVKRLFGVTIPLDRQHIVGHNEICPKKKPNCPGELYPFDEIIRAVAESEKPKVTVSEKPKPKEEVKVSGKFKDVPDIHWAKTIIESLAEKGIVAGRADGTFAPDVPITRAEAAALIGRLVEKIEKAGVKL